MTNATYREIEDARMELRLIRYSIRSAAAKYGTEALKAYLLEVAEELGQP